MVSTLSASRSVAADLELLGEVPLAAEEVAGAEPLAQDVVLDLEGDLSLAPPDRAAPAGRTPRRPDSGRSYLAPPALALVDHAARLALVTGQRAGGDRDHPHPEAELLAHLLLELRADPTSGSSSSILISSMAPGSE